MTKILVTGGQGFLGSHLVRRLRERGDEVRVMAHAQPGKSRPENEASGSVLWGDIRDPAFVDQAVSGMDKVVHTVSNFRRGGSDREDAWAVNVLGTRLVMEASARHGVQRVVHCSTIGVHGSVREIPADEDTPFNPGDLYQETKLEAEECVWQLHQESGLPVSVIRPISMYGPGDERMLKLFRMIRKGMFVFVGDGSVLFQPAYIDDVVDGFLLALDKDAALGEAFIIGGDAYLPLKDLTVLIAGELGVHPPRLKVPMGPVLALASLTERVFAPLGLEPPLHRRRVSFYQNNRAFTVEKARRLLGYEPRISLQDGLRRTIDWYQKQGWL